MKGASETEVFLERLVQPMVTIGSRLLRPMTGRVVTSWLWRSVWCRYWGWVNADEIESVRGLSQRASYQRIVVSAQAGIVLLVSLLVLASYIRQPDMVTLTAQRPITLADLRVSNESKAVAETYPGAKRNIPRDERREGFLGFVNLVPEEANRVPEPRIPELSDVYATGSDTTFRTDQPVSYSPVEGDLDTVVIPVNVEYLDSEFEPALELVTRPPYVVKKVDPQFPEIYRMDELVEGFVSISVLVDERGKLAQFVPVTPEGKTLDMTKYFVQAEFMRSVTVSKDGTRTFGSWKVVHDTYFAKNFGKVIPDWVFGPGLKDSRPVNGDLDISYYFCLDYPNCTELTLDDVIKSVLYSLKQTE